MAQLEVLQKYLKKGTDLERDQLMSLLKEVDRGNRAAVKNIKKINGTMSGCDSWEAVCAQWLVDHDGRLANNLRGVDSIMLRMVNEINSPFSPEVLVGDENADIDWSSPEFQPPAEPPAGPPTEPPTLTSPRLTGEKLGMALVSVITDALAEAETSDVYAKRVGKYPSRLLQEELAESPNVSAEPRPALLASRGLVLEAASLILLHGPPEQALADLQQLFAAATSCKPPSLLVARVREKPDQPETLLYAALVGEATTFRAMGFDLTTPNGELSNDRMQEDLASWSDSELKALLKVREARRRSRTRPAERSEEQGDGAQTQQDDGAQQRDDAQAQQDGGAP